MRRLTLCTIHWSGCNYRWYLAWCLSCWSGLCQRTVAQWGADWLLRAARATPPLRAEPAVSGLARPGPGLHNHQPNISQTSHADIMGRTHHTEVGWLLLGKSCLGHVNFPGNTWSLDTGHWAVSNKQIYKLAARSNTEFYLRWGCKLLREVIHICNAKLVIYL